MIMSTASNKKWTRVDARRKHAYELLELWLNGNRDYVLEQLERNPQPRRLLAAVACVALERGHGDRYLDAAREICDRIYREIA
jgi:hypothetical protein